MITMCSFYAFEVLTCRSCVMSCRNIAFYGSLLVVLFSWETQVSFYLNFFRLKHSSGSSKIYILNSGGAGSVMVIIIGNGYGDMSSNPGQVWLHFTKH